MKKNIYDVSAETLSNESVEDHAMLEHLLAEARACNALEFFEIEYDHEKRTVAFPDAFDFEEALETVNQYFNHLDDDEAEYGERAKQYDEHTESARGADDGTYDYAGTYVISILSIFKAK